MQKEKEYFMQEALKEAVIAFENDEVPVGAVIEYKGKIIAKAHNQVELLGDPTAHAEMIAVTQATNFLKAKWLNDCSVYVTIEPCSMCAGALVLARIKNLYYGADDPKTGACGSVISVADEKKLNHHISIKKGVLSAECGLLLKEFFQNKRTLQSVKNN